MILSTAFLLLGTLQQQIDMENENGAPHSLAALPISGEFKIPLRHHPDTSINSWVETHAAYPPVFPCLIAAFVIPVGVTGFN